MIEIDLIEIDMIKRLEENIMKIDWIVSDF
jgi:hypothetical protein